MRGPNMAVKALPFASTTREGLNAGPPLLNFSESTLKPAKSKTNPT